MAANQDQGRTTGRASFLKADQALVEEEVGGSRREGQAWGFQCLI